jgi:hypothetical protein
MSKESIFGSWSDVIKDIAGLLAQLVFLILAVVGISIFAEFPDQTYNFLKASISQFWLNVVGVAFVALVGMGLYYFRSKNRRWYGRFEVLFALAYGWYAVSKVVTVGVVEVLAIIAAIYLVVRGLDNYYYDENEYEEFCREKKMELAIKHYGLRVPKRGVQSDLTR